MIEFLAGGPSPFNVSPPPQDESKTMEKQSYTEDQSWKYAEQSMKWFGWGSPIGLGAFFMALGVFIVLLHNAGLWH